MAQTEMTPAEFTALAADIGDDREVAAAMETERTTVGRWKSGARAIPGPARVLVRILAERARAELAAEQAAVRASAKAKGK